MYQQFLKEFREFVNRGNVLDLAVGVIIGGAFGKIVSSLVNDIVTPIAGALMGGRTNFNDFFLVLAGNASTDQSLKEARDAGAAVLAYGAFITTVIDFLIIAFVVFLIVKAANSLRAKKETPSPTPPSREELILLEIRDLLKKQTPPVKDSP